MNEKSFCFFFYPYFKAGEDKNHNMLRLGDFIVMKGGNKEETSLKEVGKGGEEEQRGYRLVQSLSSLHPPFPF